MAPKGWPSEMALYKRLMSGSYICSKLVDAFFGGSINFNSFFHLPYLFAFIKD